MPHASRVERFPGTTAELAADLTHLRYDALAAFLAELAARLEADSQADAARGRVKLAAALQAASGAVSDAAGAVATAWRICEPRM